MEKNLCRRYLLIILVLAAVSMACGGGAGLPNFFATATPTSTLTPTVTPSPTPTVTPTATMTPTATVTPPPGGMTLEKQTDGSFTYYDYISGIEMQIPSPWIAISANTQNFEGAIAQAAENNPDFANSLDLLKKMDPDMFRFMALDTEPEHYSSGYITNFTVLQMQDQVSTSLPMEMLVKLTVDSIKSQYGSLEVLSSGKKETAKGLEIGFIEDYLPINLPSGAVLKTYQKQVYVIHEGYMIVITFSTPRKLSEATLPGFDEIVDSIEFFQPE